MQEFEDDEIDLLELLFALLDKWVLILISTVLAAAITMLFTVAFVAPKYKSSITFYVNNSSISVGGAKLSISSSDLSASQDLVDTYIVIFKTRDTMEAIIEDANVNLTYEELLGMVSAGAVDNTQIFKITVESTDPKQAQAIARSIGRVLPNKITSIIDGCSARIVDNPIVPTAKSSPNVKKNTLIGAAVGFVLMCAIVIIDKLLDDVIRTEDDLKNAFSIPVLASIPNLTKKSSDNDSYVYGNYGETPDKDILDILGYEEEKIGGSK